MYCNDNQVIKGVPLLRPQPIQFLFTFSSLDSKLYLDLKKDNPEFLSNNTNKCQKVYIIGNTMEYMLDINCKDYLGIFNNTKILKKILRFTTFIEMKVELT